MARELDLEDSLKAGPAIFGPEFENIGDTGLGQRNELLVPVRSSDPEREAARKGGKFSRGVAGFLAGDAKLGGQIGEKQVPEIDRIGLSGAPGADPDHRTFLASLWSG